MKIQNIRTFSDRKTDGALPRKKERKTSVKQKSGVIEKSVQSVQKQFSEIPVLKIPENISDMKSSEIFKKVQFHTPKKIDSVKQKLLADLQEVETALDDTTFRKRIHTIEKDLKTIQPKKIKKIKDLKKELDKINQLLKEIQSLRREYGGKEQKVKNLLNELNTAQKQINQWIEEDFERVRKLAGIPKLNKLEISKFLFGQRFISYYEEYLKFSGYFRKVQEKMSSDKPEKEKPPRLKGQDIYFVAPRMIPVFWLKQANISGTTNADFSISGEIKDFTFQPGLTGQPIVLRVYGERKDRAAYRIKWKYLSGSSKELDSVQVELKSIPIRNLNLPSGNETFPDAIESAKGDFQFFATSGYGKNEAVIRVTFKNPVFHFSMAKTASNRMQKIVRNIFTNIQKIEMKIRLWKEGNIVQFSLSSNLDRLLQDQLSAVLGREAKKAEASLRKEFNRQIAKQSQSFQKWLNKRIQEINAKYNVNIRQIDQLEKLQKAKKKEIEKEIKKQAGSFLNKFIK